MRVHEYDHYVELILSNPSRYNCMDRNMWASLRQAAKDIAARSTVRAVVIRGDGPHFSSGFDLGELGALGYDQVNEEFALMEEAISAVEALPIPVIAAIEGYCLGGAFELALACDLRLGDATVRMGLPVARIGIMLSQTFALRLIKVLGLGKAKELLLTGHLIGANDGRALGVLNDLADGPEALQQMVQAWVKDINALYPNAVRQAKISVGDVLPKAGVDMPYFVDEEDFFSAIRRFQRSERP